MKTRCPCCGAENSLDALIANDDARQVLWQLAQLGTGLTKLAVKYLGLFRPEKTSLSYGRMSTLLNELLPDMQSACVVRNSNAYEAPEAAWVYGFTEVLARRDAGSLKTPLKSHGYLYEVIASWNGQASQVVNGDVIKAAVPVSKQSQMLSGLQQLESLKHG